MKIIFKFLLTASLMCAGLSHADNKITIVTPLGVGSAPDRLLRVFAESLSKKRGVPVIVDNKPGGGGIIALEYYQRQPADGSFIYMAGGENVIQSPILYKREDLSANLTLVSPFITAPLVLFTSSANQSDFTVGLKKNPTFGSWAIGSTGHVCSIELSSFLQVQTIHVPYKEFGQWLTDTANQNVFFGFGSIGSTIGFEKSNRIKYLAVTSKQRLPWFPLLPTVREKFGVDLEIYQNWVAFFVPNSVPDHIRTQLENDIRMIQSDPAVRSSFESLYSYQYTISNREFQRVFESDRKTFLKFVKTYNLEIK
jgi:tripartite-type tricarboxylate transporter receptor subunit TctC